MIKNRLLNIGCSTDMDIGLNLTKMGYKYPVISELKARKKLKSPVILVNDVIKSIGRYPDQEEVIKWKPGEKDS